MAFPPEFSSTKTYANRYDLDEIDVFLEGDSNNPMFFSIDGLPKQLSIGKHYFNLSILDSSKQNYQLRSESRILFEFKSIDNVVLRSDVVDLNQKNGVATCYVDVLEDPLRTFKDIEDGEGILTVVGSLTDNYNTKIKIPEKFKGAMNYRCTFPIQIRKNLINASSPTMLNPVHKLQTFAGQFTFAKAGFSSPQGGSGNTYGSLGGINGPQDPPPSQ